MVKGIILALACFVLFLLVHALVFHNWRLKNRFHAIMVDFYGVLASYILSFWLTPILPIDSGSNTIISFLNGVFVYVFLFFGYCQFYFIIDRSISVRVMIEIDKSQKKQLGLAEIKQVYDLEDLMTRRLAQMVSQNYIVKNGDHYVNTHKGRYEAKLFGFLKEFLHLTPGG